MRVEKFLKIGQQMSAKVPHTHGFGIFFQKKCDTWRDNKNGHTYLISNQPYSFKISSFAAFGISEA
jgi:hypothetical protein